MAITLPRFLYGWRVTTSTNKLDFIRDGVTEAATLSLGVYTPAEFAAEVQRAMRAETGTTDIDVSFSFSTLKFTVAIDSPGNLSLLFGTGTNAASDCNGLLGFAASDETTDGSNDGDSYASDDAVGSGSPTAPHL